MAAETIAAPTRLKIGPRAARRRGAGAGRTTARSARAGSAVTPSVWGLRLFFRGFLFAAARDLGHHGRVGECRRVAERPVLGNVAEEAAHDLAGPSLRQLGREHDVGWGRELADHLADVVAQFLQHLRAAVLAALQCDESNDRLPRLRVVPSGNRSFSHSRVTDQRALDLDGGDAVTRDVHHVVDTAEEPEVAVLVDTRAVADEVGVFPAAPVGLLVARRVAEDPAKHRGPGLADHQVAAAAGRDLLA